MHAIISSDSPHYWVCPHIYKRATFIMTYPAPVVIATVPGWSINPWDSWFIFNLRKINTLLLHGYCYEKGYVEGIYGYEQVYVYISNVATVTPWMLIFQPYLQTRLTVSWDFRFSMCARLSNVHTWALFFLGHLANMSSMVPFWASADSGSVPIWGPRLKPRHPEEVVYSLNDSFSHFTQCLFPPKVPQQHTRIISYSTYRYHSHLLYITFIRSFTSYTFIPSFTSFTFIRLIHIFTSSDLQGRLAALGSLCPIQVVSL